MSFHSSITDLKNIIERSEQFDKKNKCLSKRERHLLYLAKKHLKEFEETFNAYYNLIQPF